MFKPVILMILTVFLLACDAKQEVVRTSGPTMGTQYHVSWVGNADQRDELQQAIDERLQQINRIMSTYDPNSELSQLNQQQTAYSIEISKELAEVIAEGISLHNQSGGLFDMTVGPLVNAWGFGPESHKDEPLPQERVNELLEQIGTDKLDLAEQQLTTRKGLYIDLSAIAKGWAVDQIGSLLHNHGIRSYLVDIGGELATRGQKPDGSGWRIAVERPMDSIAQREVQLILEPGDAAVATSGDYRNYFEVDGQRFSHTIDPRTGYPVTHKLASVTVVADNCLEADGWATALNVAGPEQALRLANQHKLAAYMIVRTDEGFAELVSDTFEQRFPNYAGSVEGE